MKLDARIRRLVQIAPKSDGLRQAPPHVQPMRFAVALGWSGGVALMMSAQLLFQPFVWRNFDWDEIVRAWAELAAERLVVALLIGLAVTVASRIPARAPITRACISVAAILAGALAGEIALIASGSREAPSNVGSILVRLIQWCVLAMSISTLFFLWQRVSLAQFEAHAEELRRIKLERQIVQARLQALRCQIEPHFLFNTLATVRRLHHTEPSQGAQLLAHFLDYLSSTLPERALGHDTLGREIELLQAYLGMVSVRMAGRLQVDFDIDPALLDCDFPAFSAATLVENAVKHGIGPAPEGGSVTLRSRRHGQQLEVVVADTGVGFSSNGGTGIGLTNIRSRLQNLYGARGTLVLTANEPKGVRATIRIPFSRVKSS